MTTPKPGHLEYSVWTDNQRLIAERDALRLDLQRMTAWAQTLANSIKAYERQRDEARAACLHGLDVAGRQQQSLTEEIENLKQEWNREALMNREKEITIMRLRAALQEIADTDGYNHFGYAKEMWNIARAALEQNP